MMTIKNFLSENRGRIEVLLVMLLAVGGLCIVTTHAEPMKMVNFSDMQYNPNVTATTTLPTPSPTVLPPVTSYVEETIITPEPTPTNISSPYPTNIASGRRIDQGACVSPGETIDIAGMGWYTGKLTYYGRYYDGLSGDNSSWVATYEADYRNLTNFYLEPSFFREHLGYWYITDYIDGPRGNSILFRVSETCVLTPEQNQSVIKEALNQSQIFWAYAANKSIMPFKYESGYDFIVSKNITTTVMAPDNTKTSWMFGINTQDKFYDNPLPFNTTTFSKGDTVNLPSGQYDIIFIDPGKNGIVEETYDLYYKRLSSPFRSQNNESTYGINSRSVEDMLKARIASSYDDSYKLWRVFLQDPSIEVKRISQMTLSNNHSYIVIAGYTNANAGDTLTITFDANTINPKPSVSRSWEAVVQDPKGINAYRIWNASFLIDFNEVFPGQHYFTVTSENGASATVPIYRRIELVDHYIPDEEMAFFSNSPFIPTPTPEVIKEIQTVQLPAIIETVLVPVTPSQKSVDDAWWNGMIGVVGIIVVVVVAGYVLVAGIRGRRNRRMKY